MSLFECENTALGYGGVPVVKDLSFRVERGDYLCVVGENGSGKSTLIKTLLGLAKPLAGKLIRAEEASPRHIGYMPQQTLLQKDFPASVREIVLSGRLGSKGAFSFYTKKDLQEARRVMARLGIENLEKRCCRELSGGQQQRVMLARALLAAKAVLVADEPCAGLDAASTEELYTLMRDLNRSDGLTVIMVTHDAEAVRRYADKVLHLGENCRFCTREVYFSETERKPDGGNASCS